MGACNALARAESIAVHVGRGIGHVSARCDGVVTLQGGALGREVHLQCFRWGVRSRVKDGGGQWRNKLLSTLQDGLTGNIIRRARAILNKTEEITAGGRWLYDVTRYDADGVTVACLLYTSPSPRD